MESLDGVCRLCLKTHIDYLFIQDDEELVDKIGRVFYFEIQISSEFLTPICDGCKRAVEDFYAFSERVEKNQRLLQIKIGAFTADHQDGIDTLTYEIEEQLDPLDGKQQLFTEAVTESIDQIVYEEAQSSWDVHGEQPASCSSAVDEEFLEDESQISEDNANHDASHGEVQCDTNTNSIQGTLARNLKKPSVTQILEHYQLSCELCSTPLVDIADLLHHYKEQHKISGYLSCCNRKIYNEQNMIEHLQFHLNPESFRCNECGKNYKSSSILDSHKKAMHTPSEARLYPCATCNKTFTSKYKCRIHQQTNHRPKACPKCNKIMSGTSALNNHLHSMHSGDRRFVCETCARVFRTKQGFDGHLKHHQGRRLEDKVQCTICSAWLINKYCLTQHINRMHTHVEGGVECSTCGRSFRNERILKHHQRHSHVESRFACQICHKRFKRKLHMMEHIAIHHTGEELYQCQYCPERFKMRNKYLLHRKAVHPEEFKQEIEKRLLKL